jgi:hypothetical protein
MAKWSHLDGPIRQAVVDGKRPADILRAIKAGTLPGVEHPSAISDRSFFDRLKEAKRDLARGGKTGEGSPLERLGRELAERDALPRQIVEEGLAEGADPEEILEQIVDSARLDVAKANELLPPELRLDPDDPGLKRLRVPAHMRDMRGPEDVRRRGRQMIADGYDIRAIAAQTQVPLDEAGALFGAELAKRDAAASGKIGD